MTKRELLKVLEALPDDTIVVVNAGKNILANGQEVTSVETVTQHAFKTPLEALTWNIDYFHEAEPDADYLRRTVINIHS